MKVIITFAFCCDHLWKSKFVALEKPGKLSEFFSRTLWPPCIRLLCVLATFSNHWSVVLCFDELCREIVDHL